MAEWPVLLEIKDYNFARGHSFHGTPSYCTVRVKLEQSVLRKLILFHSAKSATANATSVPRGGHTGALINFLAQVNKRTLNTIAIYLLYIIRNDVMN